MKKSTNQFLESKIQFNFGPTWEIIAFDKTKFYQRVSGLGVKGVDFLGIQDNKLFFIEVKNFTQHKPILTKDFNFEVFLEKIIIKFEDSERVIQIIHKHYTAKWWYNLVDSLPPYLHKFKNRNFVFWEKCYSIMNSSENKINFVLWMEHDFDTEILNSKLQVPISKYFNSKITLSNSNQYLLKDLTIIEPE